MTRKKNEEIDLTHDGGQSKALNMAWKDYEDGGDRNQAMTRSALVGRGISIRTLRLREEQFARNKGKK